MGDHRVGILIRMQGHGITKQFDTRVNWFTPGAYHPMVDNRPIEFMAEAWTEMLAKYDRENLEAEGRIREMETRERELAELARLKEKYEGM